MSREDRNALLTAKRICDAVIAVVNDTPTGAPGGVMYAALMTESQGRFTLAQFEAMMRLLVETGRVTRRGELYFPAGA
jgi:hypothetical protein